MSSVMEMHVWMGFSDIISSTNPRSVYDSTTGCKPNRESVILKHNCHSRCQLAKLLQLQQLHKLCAIILMTVVSYFYCQFWIHDVCILHHLWFPLWNRNYLTFSSKHLAQLTLSNSDKIKAVKSTSSLTSEDSRDRNQELSSLSFQQRTNDLPAQ